MSKNQPATKINEIEWDVVSGENTDFAIEYPRFQWVHGSAQGAGFMKSGGLFVSAENYPNFAGEGFEAVTLITREGTEIPGFGSTRSLLAVIRIKHQWVKDQDYGKNVPLAQALVCVKGCEDIVSISLRGASKSLAFQKAFSAHMTQNVAFANRMRPKDSPAIEPFALWFPMCAGPLQDIQSKDGKSKSKITPIELCTPQTLDREYITSLWVGRENYSRFAAAWQDTKKWQSAPIWEQNHNNDAPTHTGTADDPGRATRNQIEFIAGIIEAKSLDVAEIEEMCLAASNGATTNMAMLTQEEAAVLIETAKAY